MSRDEVRVAVRTILMMLGRVARKTSTPSDDFMVTVLNANEDRLVEAVVDVLQENTQSPTEEKISQALTKVGIKV